MTWLLSFRVASEPFGPWRPRWVWILGRRVVCERSDSKLPRSLCVTTQVAFGSRTRTETCRDFRSFEFRQHCRQSSSNFIQFLQKNWCWRLRRLNVNLHRKRWIRSAADFRHDLAAETWASHAEAPAACRSSDSSPGERKKNAPRWIYHFFLSSLAASNISLQLCLCDNTRPPT